MRATLVPWAQRRHLARVARRVVLPAMLGMALPYPFRTAKAEPAHALGRKDEQAVEVVVTGTRTPEQTQRATLRTGVVTREEAERRGATNVAEALAGEPGLQVNPNDYGYVGSPSGVQIQGLDAERVLILRDGERVIGDFGGVIDLSAYSLTDVDRIEYVSGPTSSLYGTGALGGVINIISGPPAAAGVSNRSRVEARSLPSYLAEDALSYRLDPYWLSSDLRYQWSHGLALFSGRPDLSLPESERLGVGLRLGQEGERFDSLLTAAWSREEAQGLQSEEVPVLGRFLVDLPERTDRIQLRNVERVKFGEGSQLQSSLAAQWFINRSLKDRRNSALDERRFRDQNLLSAELTGSIADAERTWVLGLRGEREAFQQRLERTVAVQGELAETEREEVAPIQLLTAAAYGQLGWKVGSSWVVTPGVRVELHDRFGVVVAPRLAGAWFPEPHWQVRASAGSGFRAPSAKEFGFFFDHSFLGYRVIGNEELRPETSWGINGDVSFAATSHTTLRVGGFYNWVSNLIATDFAGQELMGVDDFTYTNVGRARTAGLETSANWKLSPILRSQLAYSYLYTRNDDSEQPLSSRPPHTLVTALTCNPLPSFEVHYRQRFVSEAFLSPGAHAPGFIMLDLRVSYTPLPPLTLYSGVLNALDAQDDPLRPGDQRPLEGRIFLFGVESTLPAE